MKYIVRKEVDSKDLINYDIEWRNSLVSIKGPILHVVLAHTKATKEELERFFDSDASHILSSSINYDRVIVRDQKGTNWVLPLNSDSPTISIKIIERNNL